MELEYKLSDKARQKLLKQGEEYSEAYQTVEFQPADLTPEARECWVEMFGTDTVAKLRPFEIYGGQIYEDGSVSSDEPYVSYALDWLEQDEILTPQTVSQAILQLHKQYNEVKTQLKECLPEWQKARKQYEEKLAKQKAEEKAEKEKREAEEKARQERLANLGWIKQLTQKVAIESEKEAEIKRFCEKFELEPTDLQVDDISDKPYVRLSAIIPVTIGGFERTLEITNKVYHDIGENYEWEEPEFSDLCKAIADALAEIFNGEVKIVTDFNRGISYLNVVANGDTINVATAELENPYDP